MNTNIIWASVGPIATAVIPALFKLFSSVEQGLRHIVENWSPTARYRELRLLRGYESKVKEMDSASSEIKREAFASFINDDYCKITQMKFVSKLKNYRKNFNLKAGIALSPEALFFLCPVTIIFISGFF